MLVKQNGPGACHTSERSVLLPSALSGSSLARQGAADEWRRERCGAGARRALGDHRRARRGADPTRPTLHGCCPAPRTALLKKIGEEATEVVMAAKDARRRPASLRGRRPDVSPARDVLARHGLTPETLADELAVSAHLADDAALMTSVR